MHYPRAGRAARSLAQEVARPASFFPGSVMDQYVFRQQRKLRRRASRRHLFVWSFIVFEGVIGAMSGICIGAIILNWWKPGHPIYQTIKDFLERVFY